MKAVLAKISAGTVKGLIRMLNNIYIEKNQLPHASQNKIYFREEIKKNQNDFGYLNGRQLNTSQSICVYFKLKELIVNFDLKPKERLHINDLASRFGISPTPVREALNRLAAENFIFEKPQKGFFCKELVLEDILEDIDLLHALVNGAVETIIKMDCYHARIFAKDIANYISVVDKLDADCLEEVGHYIFRSIGNKNVYAIFSKTILMTHFVRKTELSFDEWNCNVKGILLKASSMILDEKLDCIKNMVDEYYYQKKLIIPHAVDRAISEIRKKA